MDPRELSEKAWQLFFGELREEGLALIDEADAERLSVRCFKLAETFLRTRHRRFAQPVLTVGGPEDRRPDQREPRPAPAPRPAPVTPIEKRLPDDPSGLSKDQAEALIEEAQEVAEARAEHTEDVEVEARPEPVPSAPDAAAPAAPTPETEAAKPEPAEAEAGPEAPTPVQPE